MLNSIWRYIELFALSLISWNGAGIWNCSLWKTGIYSYYKVDYIYIYIHVFIEVIADLPIVQDIRYTIKHNTYKIYNKKYIHVYRIQVCRRKNKIEPCDKISIPNINASRCYHIKITWAKMTWSIDNVTTDNLATPGTRTSPGIYKSSSPRIIQDQHEKRWSQPAHLKWRMEHMKLVQHKNMLSSILWSLRDKYSYNCIWW